MAISFDPHRKQMTLVTLLDTCRCWIDCPETISRWIREDSQIDFAAENFFARFSHTPNPPCLEAFQSKIDNQFKICTLADVDNAILHGA